VSKKHWYLLSLVGKDRPGIVAKLSAGLCKNGCNLGDSSMARLGNNFVIMLAVQYEGSQEALSNILGPLVGAMNLKQNIIIIDEGTHNIEPDVRINIYSDERIGVLDDATGMLTESGLNITSLESNLSKTQAGNNYSIHIEGTVSNGINPLYAVLDRLLEEKNIQSQLIPINSQVI
jgi:glycine cleavage system transcriptional repressor